MLNLRIATSLLKDCSLRTELIWTVFVRNTIIKWFVKDYGFFMNPVVPASNPGLFGSFKLWEFIMSIPISKETVKILSLCKKSRTGHRHLWDIICAMVEPQINLICIYSFINWVKNKNYWNVLELIYFFKYIKTYEDQMTHLKAV